MDLALFGRSRRGKDVYSGLGTHGQEGFLGSALQVEFLRDLQIPKGVNVLALHALNPWGFSHLSRRMTPTSTSIETLPITACRIRRMNYTPRYFARCAPMIGRRKQSTGALPANN